MERELHLATCCNQQDLLFAVTWLLQFLLHADVPPIAEKLEAKTVYNPHKIKIHI